MKTLTKAGFVSTIYGLMLLTNNCTKAQDLSGHPEFQKDASWSVQQLTSAIQDMKERLSVRTPLASLPEMPFVSIDFSAYASNLSELPIGVFDSGIGGLTVLEAILTSDLHDNQTGQPGPDGLPDLQNERFIYLGDQANMPYGNYPERGREDYLRELILKDSIFLLGNRYWSSPQASSPSLDKPAVKAIVIACNTATAFGLEDLRSSLQRWNLPIITLGVVEAGASAVMDHVKHSSDAGAVAVLATMGTCHSGAYPRSIRKTAGQRGLRIPEIIQQGSLGLAGAIEGDPAFVSSQSEIRTENPIRYRGPSVHREDAKIDPSLATVYGFDMQEVIGNPNDPTTWKLNSIENYIRYDITTLVENHRKNSHPKSEPIRYAMLGCTHFPLEGNRILDAFARLRAYRDESGSFPYQDCIADQVQLVNPAELTAKDLFRQLFLKRCMASASTPQKVTHQLFISVPHTQNVDQGDLEDGWFNYDFKYGRQAGRYSLEQTKIVPLTAALLPSTTATLLKSYAPRVCQLLGLSQSETRSASE